jgi:hypothetical protein
LRNFKCSRLRKYKIIQGFNIVIQGPMSLFKKKYFRRKFWRKMAFFFSKYAILDKKLIITLHVNKKCDNFVFGKLEFVLDTFIDTTQSFVHLWVHNDSLKNRAGQNLKMRTNRRTFPHSRFGKFHFRIVCLLFGFAGRVARFVFV